MLVATVPTDYSPQRCSPLTGACQGTPMLGPRTTTGSGRGWGYGRTCARRRGHYASPRHGGKEVRGYLRDKGIRAGRDTIVELTARRRPLKQSKEVPHAANLKASASLEELNTELGKTFGGGVDEEAQVIVANIAMALKLKEQRRKRAEDHGSAAASRE